MIRNRNLTLEQRIARLERMLKDEARNANGHISGSWNSFEDQHNEKDAEKYANMLVKKFMDATGIALRRDASYPIVNSPVFGWTSSRDLNEDPDAYYVFKYDVPNRDISVYACPSKDAVCLWVSLGDESDCEGAVNPRTGECEWEDDIMECMYPLDMWRRFDLRKIHMD